MTERALAKSISKKFVKGGAEGVAGLGCQDSSSGCARNQLNRNYAYDMCANGKQLSLFRGIIAGKLNLKLLVPSSQSFSFFSGAPNVPNVTFASGTKLFQYLPGSLYAGK